MKTTWQRAILHVDMDAFYVNIYLRQHPEQRGKPLVIARSASERGVVSSASYEARRFGIHSAMPTYVALGKCPNLIVANVSRQAVVAASKQIMDVLKAHGQIETVGYDEAFVDLTSVSADPVQRAYAIADSITQHTQLPSSFGLATNKLVAKAASNFNKPQGRTVVRPGEEAQFLAPQPVGVLWGVGQKTRERLHALGIETCHELASADPCSVIEQVGLRGADIHQRARGIDARPLKSPDKPRTMVSQERTFQHDISDNQRLLMELMQLSEAVGKKLQQQKLYGRTVFIKFRLASFETFTRQMSLTASSNDSETIWRTVQTLWQQHRHPNWYLRMVGVGMKNLTTAVESTQAAQKNARTLFDVAAF